MNLDKIFNPKTIAVIGASHDADSVGHGILRNLVKGCVFKSNYCKQFKGSIYPINPDTTDILGLNVHKSILDIEDDIDLAIIAVPSRHVYAVVKECIKKKVNSVIIISAGFAETGEKGKQLQDKIAEELKKAGIPLIGPNCLGIIRPYSNLNASFAPSMPPEGNVAFISQSGAIADSIIDWAIAERYGFSALISYGNRAGLDVSDFIEWLGKDKRTDAIALYIEGINDGKKFMDIATKTTSKKPVIVLKAGKTEKGTKAISSHTGSLAGSYRIYKAAFRQSNVITADSVEELFDIAKAVANQPALKQNKIGIITNGGGCGVLCADYCSELGLDVVELKKSTIKKLDSTNKMHPAYSRANPLDLVGDALPERYSAAVNVLLDEKYISGLIIIQTLQTMTNPEENARVIIEASKKHPEKPIICVYMGGKYSARGARLLEANNLPDYNDIKKAAIAMNALLNKNH